jgi:hypothetical protein
MTEVMVSEHTGKTVSLEEADRFLKEVRKIMLDRALNFGPAVEEWSKQQQKKQAQEQKE